MKLCKFSCSTQRDLGGANFAPSPNHPGYSDCGTFLARTRRAPIRHLQSRKLQLSRIVNRSCFFRCAMLLRRSQQTAAGKPRTMAASLRLRVAASRLQSIPEHEPANIGENPHPQKADQPPALDSNLSTKLKEPHGCRLRAPDWDKHLRPLVRKLRTSWHPRQSSLLSL